MLIPPEIFNEIQELIELQDKLYDICDDNYSEFFKYLSNSPFLSNSIYVRKLLLCIYSAFRFNFKNTSVLCRILVEIKEYLQKYLTSDEIVMNLRNNAARVALFECGLISIDSIIKDSNFNNFCFRFFYPEIKEHNEEFYKKSLIDNAFLKKTMGYLAPDLALHKELRRQGKSEHKITQIIRDDDIDAFQNYISLQNFAITEQVPYSVYDTNDFANSEDKMPYLIECSAFYGSIKIFKYIYMALQSSNIELPTSLPSYAVAGGNYDIIHIVEEHFKKNSKNTINNYDDDDDDDDGSDDDDDLIEQRINLFQNFLNQYNRNLPQNHINNFIQAFLDKRQKLSTFARSNVIQAAIEFHRNNILEYIIDNYHPKAEKLWRSSKTFISTIQFLNFRQMLYFLTSDENDENESSSGEDSDNDVDEIDNNDEIKDEDCEKGTGEEKKVDEINEENQKSVVDNVKQSEDDIKKEDNVDVDNADKDCEDENNNDEKSNEEDEEEENAKNKPKKTKWIFDINKIPSNGYAPLIQSVFESRIDVIRFVLSAKDVNVNITTHDGCTPLMLASMYGYVSIVKILCEMKSDQINFNQTNNNGSTAFMMACHYDRLDIIEYLASLTKAKPKLSKLENENESTKAENHEDESSKKDIFFQENTNEAQLENKDDDEKSSELLIDINKPDLKGYCPFYVACMVGNLKIVKFLASFNHIKMFQNGKIPRQIAIYGKRQDVVDFLDNNPTYQKQKSEFESQSENSKKESCFSSIRNILSDDGLLRIHDDNNLINDDDFEINVEDDISDVDDEESDDENSDGDENNFDFM